MRKKFTVLTVPERLAKQKNDPWADYDRTEQGITAAMWKALGKK